MATNYHIGYHNRALASEHAVLVRGHWDTQFRYTFENFFHPFVDELIGKLNRDSLRGLLDAGWQDRLQWSSLHENPDSPPQENFDQAWQDSVKPGSQRGNYFKDRYAPTDDRSIHVAYSPKQIDIAGDGPYANYNWELFFHVPLTIAVHLSKNQRFAEAQRWFHYLFDPTSTDPSEEPPERFWRFLAFRKDKSANRIEELLVLLSTPESELSTDDRKLRESVMAGYHAILNKPFRPHAVARIRCPAYQYAVVMKYLDNLIAWGDHLFHQDTVESINEAMQRYVLAANLLGPRPQRIPPLGTMQPKTFAQLKKQGLDEMGNALERLEHQFPFNFAGPDSGAADGAGEATLFGIGRSLYFCIPRNDKLLGYWDTVGDRLFKIRHGMNIEGLVRPLALFDPPLDPGMLVKAAAAGIDVGTIVSGRNQPVGPVRSLYLIQKALELSAEVRGLGGALLSALEKGDAEHLALVRQHHEVQLQQMAQEVRFLQWKSTQEATKSLLTTRATALERLRYYQRLLGLPADQNAPDMLVLQQSATPDDPPKLTEENFDETYAALVGEYDKPLSLQAFPDLKLAGESPAQDAGASGQGKLYLNANENAELNVHSPAARDLGVMAAIYETIASFVFIPDASGKLHFWGLGAAVDSKIGTAYTRLIEAYARAFRTKATYEHDQAGMAWRKATHERRADEWLLQYNLAAHELMQIGRQILTSLIAEQVAQHDYHNVKQQIANAQEVDQFLHDKFTNEDLYLWMQGETSRLYYEYYRFAFDTARRAERAMKQELMRPELEAQDFVKFNYWDGGRKGLLSGEGLYLDVKRMELAYHDNNKRELELTRHVSLRQLDPLALLTLKATGSCQLSVPEWLYDMDCPGHYMRRIKTVSLSIPSVVGPYTSIHCTLSLLKSSLRKSPVGDDYPREGSEDDRFADYIGSVQSVVTSTGQNDSGLFETNLRDERFLPFEGAGAVSTWKLELPKEYPAFDYATISDVILHIRYTARQGVDAGKVTKALPELFQNMDQANLVVLFSLRHDFPTEWASYVGGTDDFTATIRRNCFPYFAQGKDINIKGYDLYAVDGTNLPKHHRLGDAATWDAATEHLKDRQTFTVKLPADDKAISPKFTARTANGDVVLILKYTLE